ncbi:MAG: hypothetical protein WCG31_08435 [Deltaproteobacteria bacterium]
MNSENLQAVKATGGKQQWTTPTINDWEIKDVTLSGIIGIGVDGNAYS